LPLLPAKVFDACITDPPYGLGIAAWDRATPGPEVWRGVLRVMKDGAWLIAFGGRRTYHRVATSIEEGGFDSVDMGSWMVSLGAMAWARSLDQRAASLAGCFEVNADAGATANEIAVAGNLSRPPKSAQVRRRFSELRNGQRELTLPAPFRTLLPSRTGAATHVD
jgi:hypothetical protein